MAGAVNSVAGGGTLLTFPTLMMIGVPAKIANATSTVALWPGALSSLWGYRKEMAGSRPWLMRFGGISLIGGLVGAGAGTGGAAFTGNRDVELPAETGLRFRLVKPLEIPQ